MVRRGFWLQQLAERWERHSIIWLTGVRRVGKTVFCQALPGVEYFDCELPRVRQRLVDPESFLGSVQGKQIAVDEIHRLPNPPELLKIAADHYPSVKIIATGSSSLGASARFGDTLAGRKAELWLTPVLQGELEAFGHPDLRHRLLRGGLPSFLLAPTLPEAEFQEWLDAFWARDVLALFRLERRASFQRLVELLFINSGGMFEATYYAQRCELSRSTVRNYLAVLEATFVAHVVRPFNTRQPRELVAVPKVYAFDTGFVCGLRGWEQLRPDDLGPLWEHLVLNELHAHLGRSCVHYWRDKAGHEVDFVVSRRGRHPVAVECQWSAASFAATGLLAFHERYPEADLLVVAADVTVAYEQRCHSVPIGVLSLPELCSRLTADRGERASG